MNAWRMGALGFAGIPARTRGEITTTCDVTGEGTLVSIMPHTHSRAIAFDAELLGAGGTTVSIFHDGGYDTESEITVLDDPIELAGFTRVRHTCTVENDLDRPIVWGVGDDEMCTLFGYMYPPSAQQIGFVPERTVPGVEPPCVAVPIGKLRR